RGALWSLLIITATISVARVGLADCSLTTTGFVPVNDLGTHLYNGVSAGLYPNGSNNPPAAHLNAAVDVAINQIEPLNSTGSLDRARGKIVLISVGMSNTTMEFSRFVSLANSDAAKNPQLVIVDGAQGGQ